MPIERKLAAIMFTDIVGSTAQMSKDEAVAMSLLNKKESVLKPLIAKHNGTYVKSTGDGSLSHFSSAVDAATCAKRFQESIYDDKDLNVRVGVHLGDTIFEKGDIRGDGVNIASRLESMAVEGGVFVSKEVHDQLSNQKEFEGVSLGLQSMKGVGRLIEVYGLKGDKLSEPNPNEYEDNKIDKHSDGEVPSIAIIPLKNKGDDKDVFYAYGISADLIKDCSSAGLIRVASLEDIEKVENWDKLKADELASTLLVRYIAQGTLWKMDDMFQLSVELYDTKDKKVVWSDRWEEEWDNLPTIKMNLSDGLLKALDTKPKVEQKIDTANPEAYEYYLRGYHIFKNINATDADYEVIIDLLKKSLNLNHQYMNAYDVLGWCYIYKKNIKIKDKYAKAIAIWKEGISIAKTKNINSKNNNIGSLVNSISLIYLRHKYNYKKAYESLIQSQKLLKNLNDIKGIMDNYNILGIYYSDIGDYENGILYFSKVKKYEDMLEIPNELSVGNTAYQYHYMGEFDKAEKMYIKAAKLGEEKAGYIHPLHHKHLADVYIDMKEYEKAKATLDKVEKFENYNIKDNNNKLNERKLRQGYFTFLIAKTLSKKKLNINISKDIKEINEISELRKKNKFIDDEDYKYFRWNYYLYQVFEDFSYLNIAYKYIIETADNLEPDVAAKFLSYPIPKAIVEEWEKVK